LGVGVGSTGLVSSKFGKRHASMPASITKTTSYTLSSTNRVDRPLLTLATDASTLQVIPITAPTPTPARVPLGPVKGPLRVRPVPDAMTWRGGNPLER